MLPCTLPACRYLHGEGEVLRREEWEAGKAALTARREAEANPRPKALLSAGRWVRSLNSWGWSLGRVHLRILRTTAQPLRCIRRTSYRPLFTPGRTAHPDPADQWCVGYPASKVHPT